MKDVVLPAISKVVFDRAPAVRKQLVVTLATWFATIREIRQFQAPLFPLLLAGVVDESPEVQQVTREKLDELAPTLARRASEEDGESEQLMAVDEGDSNPSAVPLAAYFPSGPPAPSVRKLAVRWGLGAVVSWSAVERVLSECMWLV